MSIRKRNAGMALVFVMIAIIVVGGSLALVMTQVQSSKKEADHAYDEVVLESAALAGIDMAVEQLWNRYVSSSGNTTRNWASYRYFLDNELQIPINEDLNGNNQRDTDEVGNGDTVFDTLPDDYHEWGWSMIDEPIAFRDPETERVIANIDSIHVARYDELSRANITVRATASVGGKTKTATQVMGIGGASLPHTQFAILANNISCILCHAEFLSLDLERNSDSGNYGDFDRVKIAALESMLVRKSSADSNVAGTVYTRGKVYQENGSEFSASELASSDFKSYSFSSENGKIDQDGSGNMTEVSLANGDTDAEGDLEQFANLYMEYPTDVDAQTDGPLPNGFPAPYPDENENRYVDDEEFDKIVNVANGRLEFEFGDPDDAPGSVTAGVAYGIPEGSVYTPEDGNYLPTASNSALSSLASTGSYDGNLILVGTDDDPIIIDKTVAVNGDLVIKGPVKGYGQLLVRGNTYVMGDITYADAPGEFGAADDGTENAFALVSGGSIMMGDYLTVRGVNHSAKNNKKYPTWSQYSIHTRAEHKSNNITKNDVTETLEWGWFDEWAVDSGESMPQLKDDPNGRPGDQYSFTTSELMLFNNMELDKALDDPDYVPRFYGLRENQPNNIYIYDDDDEHSVRYSENGVKLLSDYLIEEGLPMDVLNRAAYHYCSPDMNWISEDTLRHVWFDDEMSRPSSGRPFKFDGLLYSNNSIWNIVRSKTRHKSYTYGKMEIRGGIIAADLGVFVPGGLDLMYDPRVERFLEINDTTVVVLQKVASYFERPELEEEEA